MSRNKQFRNVKRGDPEETLRILAEDLHRRPRRRKRSLFSMVARPIAAIAIGGLAVAWEQGGLKSVASPLSLFASGGCNIKGNVSIDTGERIYHVPGQKYYEATRVSPQYGERWFCSEQEARSAGWRKSRT